MHLKQQYKEDISSDPLIQTLSQKEKGVMRDDGWYLLDC